MSWAPPVAAADPVRLQHLRAEGNGVRTTVTVELSAAVPYVAGSLAADGDLPPRLYVDLDGVVLGPVGKVVRELASGPIRRIRTGQFTTEQARLVLDLAAPLPYTIETTPEPFRLVIRVGASQAEAAPARPEPAASQDPSPAPAQGASSTPAADEPTSAAAESVPAAPPDREDAALERALSAHEPVATAMAEPARAEAAEPEPQPEPEARATPEPHPARPFRISPSVAPPLHSTPPAPAPPATEAVHPEPALLVASPAPEPGENRIAKRAETAAPEPPARPARPFRISPAVAPPLRLGPPAPPAPPVPVAATPASSAPDPAQVAAAPAPPVSGPPAASAPPAAVPQTAAAAPAPSATSSGASNGKPAPARARDGHGTPGADANGTGTRHGNAGGTTPPGAPPAAAPPAENPATVAYRPPTFAAAPRIIVDPGHGGHDPGARSLDGTWEKDIVLELSRRLARRLRERLGVETVLTREDDRTLSIAERAALAGDEATLLISVHANTCPEPWIDGVETYYSPASPQAALSRHLARLVHARVMEAVQAAHGPVRDGGVRERSLEVLRTSRVPSVLLEAAYISNEVDGRRLADPAYQEAVANGAVDGIADFLSGVPATGPVLARR